MKNKKKITVEALGMKKSMPNKDVISLLEKVADTSYDAGKNSVLRASNEAIEKALRELDKLTGTYKRQVTLSFWTGAISITLGFVLGRLIFYLFF